MFQSNKDYFDDWPKKKATECVAHSVAINALKSAPKIMLDKPACQRPSQRADGQSRQLSDDQTDDCQRCSSGLTQTHNSGSKNNFQLRGCLSDDNTQERLQMLRQTSSDGQSEDARLTRDASQFDARQRRTFITARNIFSALARFSKI